MRKRVHSSVCQREKVVLAKLGVISIVGQLPGWSLGLCRPLWNPSGHRTCPCTKCPWLSLCWPGFLWQMEGSVKQPERWSSFLPEPVSLAAFRFVFNRFFYISEGKCKLEPLSLDSFPNILHSFIGNVTQRSSAFCPPHWVSAIYAILFFSVALCAKFFQDLLN